MLASGGLVAFAAYLYHRIVTVVLALRNRDIYRIFMGLCLMGLLIEVIFFATYPVIIYSVMLLFMEKKTVPGKSEAVV